MKQNEKVLEEAYKKIIESSELRMKFMKATQEGKLEQFLKELKIEATLEEINAYLTEKFTRKDGELSKGELDLAAGGKTDSETGDWVLGSILTGGLYCAIKGIIDGSK